MRDYSKEPAPNNREQAPASPNGKTVVCPQLSKGESNMIVSAFKLSLEDIQGAIKGGLLEVIRGNL